MRPDFCESLPSVFCHSTRFLIRTLWPSYGNRLSWADALKHSYRTDTSNRAPCVSTDLAENTPETTSSEEKVHIPPDSGALQR
jgi:hypothetical protein